MSRPSRTFGVTTDLSGNLGAGIIANSISINQTVEYAEARDEKGKKLDLAPYSEGQEITIDGLFIGSGVSAGQVVQIEGKDYLVTTSTKNENNQEFQTSSVTAICGDDDTVVHSLSSIQQ